MEGLDARGTEPRGRNVSRKRGGPVTTARAHTIQVMLNPESGSNDLNRPGHIFPLRAKEGGVLRRAGHTEAAIDLGRLSGVLSAGVICEIMKDDGTMARRPDLEVFAEEHGLRIISVAELIDYRLQRERLVHRVAEADVPFAGLGTFKVIAYQSNVDDEVHLASPVP